MNMTGNFLNIFLILFINACTAVPDYYEGYIFSSNKKPLANVKVCEEYSTKCVYTNSKGYFKLEMQKKSIRNLIVFSNDKPIDTVRTVWNQHGEKIKYSFIEGKKDTLFIKK